MSAVIGEKAEKRRKAGERRRNARNGGEEEVVSRHGVRRHRAESGSHSGVRRRLNSQLGEGVEAEVGRLVEAVDALFEHNTEEDGDSDVCESAEEEPDTGGVVVAVSEE